MAGSDRENEIREKFLKKLRKSIEEDNRDTIIKLALGGAVSSEVVGGSYIIRVEKGTKKEGIKVGKILSEIAEKEFTVVIFKKEVLVVFGDGYMRSDFENKRSPLGTFKKEESHSYALKLQPREVSPERIAKLMQFVEKRLLAKGRI